MPDHKIKLSREFAEDLKLTAEDVAWLKTQGVIVETEIADEARKIAKITRKGAVDAEK